MGDMETMVKPPVKEPSITMPKIVKIISQTSEQLRGRASEIAASLLNTDLQAGPLRNALLKVKKGEMGAIKVDAERGVYSMEISLLGQPRFLTFQVSKDSLTVMLSDREKNPIQTAIQKGNQINLIE